MLSETGFVEGKLHGWTGYRTSAFTQGGLVTARKPDEPVDRGAKSREVEELRSR
jgi:hypothetical protein